MKGWYELERSSDNQYKFVLKAANAEIILVSELYTQKASAVTGIESVRKNCDADDNFKRLEASNGQAYFNLVAQNHEIIGTSELYSSAQMRDKGIESVKVNGMSAILKDLS